MQHDAALLALGAELKRQHYEFTTVTPATHERVNRRDGNEWANDIRDIFGWSRRFHSSVIPSSIFGLMQEADIVEASDHGYRSLLRVSSLDKKLFFHSSYPTEQADAVFFGPDTYRFANAIRQFCITSRIPVRRAIDIGCGAGPGAILVAERYPESEVLAVDINAKALRLTAINATLATTHNVRSCFSNLLSDVDGNFDLIVSNPPYLVDPAKRAYRHGGGQLGTGLSLDILEASLNRLNVNGTLLLYTGSAIIRSKDLFYQEVEHMLRNKPVQWNYDEMDPDIFGEELLSGAYSEADRIAAVVLTVTRQS